MGFGVLRRTVDLLLPPVALALLGFAGAQLAEPTPLAMTRPRIGHVRSVSGAVTVHASNQLVWSPLREGSGVHDGHTLYAGPGARAEIVLASGEIVVESGTLLVLERSGGAERVRLRSGGLLADARAEIAVETTGGSVQILEGVAVVRATQRGTTVDLTSGRVLLQARGETREIARPGGAHLGADGIREIRRPVTLLTPAPHARLEAGKEPLLFAWEATGPGPFSLELAATDASGVRRASSHALAPEERERTIPVDPGEWSWWIAGADGPASEERRLFVQDPVTPLYPREGTVVVAPESGALLFTWRSPHPVAVMEIAASPDFRDPIHRAEVEGERTLVARLPDGVWFWRLESGGKRSDPIAFQVRSRPLPPPPGELTQEVVTW